METLLLLDVCFSAGIISITVWLFFVQAPFLFQRLGRAKFVPIMMQLVQLYFRFVFVLHGVVIALSVLRAEGRVAAYIAGLVCAFNRWIIVPRALEKGRQSMRERSGKEDSSAVEDYFVEGGSKTETKTMHQLVVSFVLADVAALCGHVLLL